MRAVAVDELVIVTGEVERAGHLLVAQRPVAELVVEIAGAVLQEDADRFPRRLADLAGINVAAPNIGEAAHVAEHLAEQVRPLPGGREGADAARADAADGPAGRVLPQVIVLAHFRQDLLLQEARILVREGIVLEAAIGRPVVQEARHNKHPDRHRQGNRLW